MPALNHLGSDEAHTIRTAAAQLAEIDNLRDTSSLREVLLDLSYALANLAGPVGAVLDQWVEEWDGEPVEIPDLDALINIAGALRHAANNS
jgi:hypothetical protein